MLQISGVPLVVRRGIICWGAVVVTPAARNALSIVARARHVTLQPFAAVVGVIVVRAHALRVRRKARFARRGYLGVIRTLGVPDGALGQ